MVRRCAVLLYLLYSVNPINSLAAELSFELDKTKIELGKFFLLKLTYLGTSDPGSVDISMWHDDFFVVQNDTDLSATKDGLIQTETVIRLYPRHTGLLTLDAIALGGGFTKPEAVLVLPSIRNGINGTPVLKQLEPQYWADQNINISVDVRLHDSRNSIVVGDFELPGFSVISLPSERLSLDDIDTIRLRWSVFTPNPGIYEIDLPAIEQKGRGRFRFYLPKLKLKIRPLPAYLPPTVPVGNVKITSRLNEFEDGFKYWLINITNTGRLPRQIDELVNYFQKNRLNYTVLESTEVVDSFNRIVSNSFQVLVPEWAFGQTPSIRLAYFDTSTGQLEYINHKLPNVWQIPQAALWASFVMLLVFCWWLILWLIKLIKRFRNWQHYRFELKDTESPHNLRQLLLCKSSSKTLNAWADVHPYKPDNRIIADQLNALCFAPKSQLRLSEVKKLLLK